MSVLWIIAYACIVYGITAAVMFRAVPATVRAVRRARRRRTRAHARHRAGGVR